MILFNLIPKIILIIYLFISFKFNIFNEKMILNYTLLILIFIISIYLTFFTKVKSSHLVLKILSVLTFLIICILIFLIIFYKFLLNIPSLSGIKYQNGLFNIPNTNERLSILSYDDGGFSGPSYVLYEKDFILGFKCITSVAVDDNYETEFDLEKIYLKIKDDNSFCKHNSLVLNTKSK